MKKVLSLFLATVLVLGVMLFSFAANDRISGVVKPLDSYATLPDLNELKPGAVLEFPLTTDMFEWRETATPALKGAVTRSDISSGNVKTILSGNTTGIVKKIEIVYKATPVTNNVTTAVVQVTFEKNLASTSGKNFDFSIFLQARGSRQPDSRVRLQGTMYNDVLTLDRETDYISLTGGKVLETNVSIRNLEIDLGKGVIFKTNVFRDQRYYAEVSTDIIVDDNSVLSRYPNITDIIRISQTGFKKGSTNVDLSAYANAYVYNVSGKYLGRANQYVELSDIYYLSDKDLGTSINTGKGNSSSDSNSSSSSNNSPTSSTPSSKPDSSSSQVVTSGKVGHAEAVKLTNAAVKKAKTSGKKTAVVVLKNKASISAEAIATVNKTSKNAGYGSQIQANTVSGKAVQGRITIFPANATNLSADVKLGVYIDGTQVQKTQRMFNKAFRNKVAVISLAQNNSFGAQVNVIARVNLVDFNKNNIYFYSYNRSNNRYYLISNPDAWIDSNGYVHFNTKLAGDIIISEGPLAKK